jgi:hypothetical protein
MLNGFVIYNLRNANALDNYHPTIWHIHIHTNAYDLV